MHFVEVPGKKGVIEIPSMWDELDQAQVLKIVKCFMNYTAGNTSKVSMMIKCFYIVAKIKRNWRSVFKDRVLPSSLRQKKLVTTYLAAEEIISFLFVTGIPEIPKIPEKQLELLFDSVHNFLPVLACRSGVNLYGPQDLLIDLTFGEFLEALNAMNDYFRTKENAQLDIFLAVLYRKTATDDTRIPLEESYKKQAKHFTKIAAEKKFTILLWFSTCIKYIKQETLIINGSEISLKVLFPEANPGDRSTGGLGWTSLLYGIAKEGLFGDIRETNKSKLFEVLLFMYDNHLKQLQHKSNT